MPHDPLTFTLIDPRTADGDPFEVAGRAARQASGVARLLALATATATLMARNAQLERNLYETPEDARAIEWEDSAQHRQLAQMHKAAKQIERGLDTIAKATEYNPKKARV